MTAIEIIKSAQETGLAIEDGEHLYPELSQPLTPEEIDRLQEQVGQPLPAELRSLLGFCSGIESCLDGIDFTGGNLQFGHTEVFPHGLPIATDGYGNDWVLDITPHTTEVAPVFYSCHDAPVMLLQSLDLASFMAEVFRIYTPPYRSLINAVHEDKLFDVWRKNPGVIDQPEALSSQDPVLRAFAEQLPANFQIIDLRSIDPGMGFSWGRYGANTENRRFGYERVFAYGKPVVGTGKGCLTSLLAF